MNETNSSKPYGPHPTPAPQPEPNPLESDGQLEEADGELDALMASYDLLTQQSQLLAQQVVSLQHKLAENGLSEIHDADWLDLQAIRRVIYVAGSYSLEEASISDRTPSIRLTWHPGCLRLCPSMKPNDEDDASLPLPMVRETLEWHVPMPTPGQMPPEPSPMPSGTRPSDPAAKHYSDLVADRQEKWQIHCRPLLLMAQQTSIQNRESTMVDERVVAYAAMQEIQERRQDPETEPSQTIAMALEKIAAPLRMQAARLSGG